MKITLISPYENIYAIGVRILSASLRQAGHDVKSIFLLNYFYEPYKKKVLEDVVELSRGSDFVGISLMTNLFTNTLQITESLKNNLHVPILWGGIHPTICPDECLKYADMICLGEGEETLVQLADKMGSGKNTFDIAGMWFNNKGRVIKNQLRPIIKDLDSIAFQDYNYEDQYILADGRIAKATEILLRKYFSSHSAYLTLATRGCPFSCAYCCNNTLNQMWPEHKYVRKRSIANIISEILAVKAKLPFIGSINFEDDSFFSYSADEIKEFCAQYKKDVNLPFSVGGITPITLDREKLALLVDTGLTNIRMGIQTGSGATRKAYKRVYTNEQVEKAAHKINEFTDKIPPPAYDLILDNPWESQADLVETLMMLTRLPSPYRLALYSLTFYPETELYRQAKKDGLISDESRDIKNKVMYGIKKGYLNKLFVLVHEYASVGDMVTTRQMKFLTDVKLRRIGLSYLLYLLLKMKVNRMPWITDMARKSFSDIMKCDFSRISLHIKSYLKTRRL